MSDKSGRNEVYVRPYPGPGRVQQISNEGGLAPVWSKDGREFFYVMSAGSNIRVMAVAIAMMPSLTIGPSRKLFEGRYGGAYDVTKDGRRFFLTQTKERPPIQVTQMILVQNWFEELKAKVPTGR